MKYDANPACCLDILMAALDEEHCGLSEAQAQSLNIGHAFSMNQVPILQIQSSFNSWSDPVG